MGAVWEVFGLYSRTIVGICLSNASLKFQDDLRITWKVLFMVFLVLSPSFYLLRRGRGRAARRGRRPLDLIGPSSDALVVFVLTCLCPPLFLLVAIVATVFESMLLQRSSFKRASRSLAKTGSLAVFLGVFFFIFFSYQG